MRYSAAVARLLQGLACRVSRDCILDCNGHQATVCLLLDAQQQLIGYFQYFGPFSVNYIEMTVVKIPVDQQFFTQT